MKACQLQQAFVAFFRQLDFDSAPVAATDAALDQRGRLASRNQRHDPVMLRLQAVGKFPYSCPFPAGEALDLQHQLILQRRNTLPARYFFAETEIAAQPVAELSKPFEILLGHGMAGLFCALFLHIQRISYCDTMTQAERYS